MFTGRSSTALRQRSAHSVRTRLRLRQVRLCDARGLRRHLRRQSDPSPTIPKARPEQPPRCSCSWRMASSRFSAASDRNALRPALTMSDIYGPARNPTSLGHTAEFCDWLPERAACAGFADRGAAYYCGRNAAAVQRWLQFERQASSCSHSAGLECRAELRSISELAKTLPALSRAAAALRRQSRFPARSSKGPLRARSWIDPDLLQYLNDKANLPELAAARDDAPQRSWSDRARYFVRTGSSASGPC